MKLNLTRSDKVFLGVIFGGYLAVIIYIVATGYKFHLEGVGQRWIYQLPFGEGPLSRVNPLTIIMTWVVMAIIIFMATRVKVFKIIPGKKQSLLEVLLDYILDLVKGSVTRKEFVRPIFDIAASLFLFVIVSNFIASFPGINAIPLEGGGVKLTILSDSWYAPTSDLNMNLMLAFFVFVMSHVYAIKVKGWKKWGKSFFEPIWWMFPINVIGEIAKPVSHALRLFGNIMGGAILIVILGYLVKYFVLPAALWGIFGLFFGAIQALIFTILAIAYISSLIE
ncbi:MAG: F0F1 ATP synthase subunit A [Thermotogaceae bacterium]|nr:F0F1 ATP synthase subunit A [Thermotogaceae bacterium]